MDDFLRYFADVWKDAIGDKLYRLRRELEEEAYSYQNDYQTEYTAPPAQSSELQHAMAWKSYQVTSKPLQCSGFCYMCFSESFLM